jgi:hypothetical protein
MRVCLAAVLGAALAGGCGTSATSAPDAAPHADGPAAAVDAAAPADAAPSLYADYVAQGCERIEQWAPDGGAGHGEPPSSAVCVGHAPLTLTFAPITSPDVESYLWDFGDAPPDGGLPPPDGDGGSLRTDPTPTHTFVLPGSYDVRLTVAGAAGTLAIHHDPPFVQVLPNPLAGACEPQYGDAQCEAGLACSCPADAPGDTSCPPELDRALCSSGCGTSADCPVGSACVDLGVTASWRQPLCLPVCQDSAGCRPGLRCRSLPAAEPAGPGWAQVCFPAWLGDLAAPCLDASGVPRPEACTGGLCLPLGLEGYCSADCGHRPCPTGAACVRLGGADGPSVCLMTCTATPCTGDPLLGCEGAGAGGDLGFELLDVDPPAGPYCAPRRCLSSADCGGLPCTDLGGVHYCQPAA